MILYKSFLDNELKIITSSNLFKNSGLNVLFNALSIVAEIF